MEDWNYMNLNIKRIGFWKEEGWSHRSIDDDLSCIGIEDKNIVDKDILEYLKIGIPVLAIRTMRYSKSTGEMFGPVTAYTDGSWAWTNILIYYYSIGWLRLPDDFKEHARNANRVFLKLGLMPEAKKNEIAAIISNPDYLIISLK